MNIICKCLDSLLYIVISIVKMVLPKYIFKILEYSSFYKCCCFRAELQLENLNEPNLFMTPLQRVSVKHLHHQFLFCAHFYTKSGFKCCLTIEEVQSPFFVASLPYQENKLV